MGPVRLVQSESDGGTATEPVTAESGGASTTGIGGFLSNATLPGILFAGSIVLIVVVLMRHARKQRSRLQKRTERPTIARSGIAEAARRDEVHAVVADAADLTRELAAVVETKAARLEALLQQADERIAAMEAQLERRINTAPPDPVDAEPRSRRSDRDAVVAMVDNGAADDEIARSTGVAIGEVELIRRLHAATADRELDAANRSARPASRVRAQADASSLDAYLAALVSNDGGTRPPTAS